MALLFNASNSSTTLAPITYRDSSLAVASLAGIASAVGVGLMLFVWITDFAMRRAREAERRAEKERSRANRSAGSVTESAGTPGARADESGQLGGPSAASSVAGGDDDDGGARAAASGAGSSKIIPSAASSNFFDGSAIAPGGLAAAADEEDDDDGHFGEVANAFGAHVQEQDAGPAHQ
jgi:hypothetical protein